jgi:hypothetical protein
MPTQIPHAREAHEFATGTAIRDSYWRHEQRQMIWGIATIIPKGNLYFVVFKAMGSFASRRANETRPVETLRQACVEALFLDRPHSRIDCRSTPTAASTARSASTAWRAAAQR